MGQTELGDDSFRELEGLLEVALERRSADGLHVLGFGETSIAIAWPQPDPTFAVKRLVAVETAQGLQHVHDTIGRYIDQVAPHVEVAPTRVRSIRNDQGWHVPYLVQPLYRPDELVEHILASQAPDPSHPILAAMRDAVVAASADGRQAIDAQFNNFAWIDDQLVLFDVGTPFLFDENGKSELDLGEMLRVMPAIFRPLGSRKIGQVIESMGSTRDSFRQAGLSLVRSDLTHWLPAALATFNPYLDEPLTEGEIHQRVIDLHKESRAVKKLLRLERWWSTTVRKRPYDMFITDSFTGELL